MIEGGGEPAARGPTDEQLVDAVQNGNSEMAGHVYDRLLGAVDHALYRVFGRREHDHDDLVQAAFEQIVLTLSRRSYARACSLQTWASTIATHVAFNALRARRRERRVFDRDANNVGEPEPPASSDLERAAGARADLERVRWLLAQMKPERAETVFLHDVLGHDLAEIALMTRVSVAAAQSRLVRGRRELRERLTKEQLMS
ncbi:MAG TPA: RNA polymerase sigma factor [Polyangiaceae bacterium]|nr:RNA polymerase sigma factor [Polyangiaceae bacterium]